MVRWALTGKAPAVLPVAAQPVAPGQRPAVPARQATRALQSLAMALQVQVSRHAGLTVAQKAVRAWQRGRRVPPPAVQPTRY